VPRPNKNNKPDAGVQLRRALCIQRPDLGGEVDSTGIWSEEFFRAEQLAGPWRTIELGVSPEQVRVRFIPTPEVVKESPPFAGGFIQMHYARLNEKLVRVPGHGIQLPGWSPRLPFGIWNDRAAIDVKDVSVFPE